LWQSLPASLNDSLEADFSSINAISYNGTQWAFTGQRNSVNSITTIATTSDLYHREGANAFAVNDPSIGYGVASDGNMWVAVGNGNSVNGRTAIIYSFDGRSWSNITNNALFGSGSGVGGGSASPGVGRCIAWNGSMWIAGGDGSATTNSYATSYDGLTWTPRRWHPTSDALANCRGVAWNGTTWLMTGRVNSGLESFHVATSTDGITWSNFTNLFGGTSADNFFGNAVAWNGNMWIIVGSSQSSVGAIARSSAIVPTSSDVWAFVIIQETSGLDLFGTSADSSVAYSVAWNGEVWVVAGDDGPSGQGIATSPDGLNWTKRTSGEQLGIYNAVSARRVLPTVPTIPPVSNNSLGLTLPQGLLACIPLAYIGDTVATSGFFRLGAGIFTWTGKGNFSSMPEPNPWTPATGRNAMTLAPHTTITLRVGSAGATETRTNTTNIWTIMSSFNTSNPYTQYSLFFN
jgi:hypothetical protein